MANQQQPNQGKQPQAVPDVKQTPGIGGINDGSGRNMTHEKQPDQNVDHDAKRRQQHPQTGRESKTDGNQ